MMSSMTSNLGASVADLGIEIIDFRVKRIDLPSELSSSVFERMRTERNRLAEELRSEGKELSNEIRSKADKQKLLFLQRPISKPSRSVVKVMQRRRLSMLMLFQKTLSFMNSQEA